MTILVTGGAGYIGSHTVVELLENNYSVVVLDNLCNSSEVSISRVEKLCGKSIHFIKGDICNKGLLNDIFKQYNINAVIHFAGLKAVGKSVFEPEEYYYNNFYGTLNLLNTMKAFGVYQMIFSSSATVYGKAEVMPITENAPAKMPTNPYGKTKLFVENMLHDFATADKQWSFGILRYFNPIGAHHSGQIGESPNDTPNNLMPYISQVAIGKLKMLSVYGDNYPTKDGTGVRDYIHVVDLAKGHLSALNYINQHSGSHIWNLGTGESYSVLEMVHQFEQITQKPVAYQIVEPRAGDVAECWASPQKAYEDLRWRAKLKLEDMIKDTWRWQSQNPNGYED